jgi:lysozyme
VTSSKQLALVALAWFAFGCGPAGPDDSETLGESDEALVAACPPPQTVLGIDIASYQHPGGAGIDWSAVAANRRFVIVKATEGTGYVNPYYADDVKQARAHGMVAGAYHFLRYSSSGAAQAQHFLAHFGGMKPGDLPPMLDVEDTNDAASPGQRAAIMKEWLDTVEAAVGRKPMIYSGSWYWGPYVGGPSGYGGVYPTAWAAYVSGCPKVPDDFPSINIWQYQGGGGKTPGIAADVDQDMFYGSEADLMAFVNATPPYRAEFVGQSFPPASQPFQMNPGQKLDAWIELRNTGSKPWDSGTHLGTTEPRDRTSPFAADDWLGQNRPASVSGTVNPGESFKFHFTFQAPTEPGSYDEHFGVVQEMVTWFSAPGQGGPADNFLEARIDVVQAQYAAQFVDQSFPAAHLEAVELEKGETLDAWIDFKNVGSATWIPGVTKLVPTPRDSESSPLEAPTWLGPTRIATLDQEVPPGETARFHFQLRGNELGEVEQTFGLVEERVTWFADAPVGGGPPDDFVRVKASVVAKHGTKTAKPGEIPTGESGGTDAVDGGCSATPAPARQNAPVFFLLVLGLTFARKRSTLPA